MDRFLEEVVVKRNRFVNELMYYFSILMMVVCGLLGMMSLSLVMAQPGLETIIPAVLFVGIAVYLFFNFDKNRTEYEYTFTNGALDFAMVFNNKKRKSLGSLNVTKVDAFGRVESGSFRRHINTPGIKKMNWFLNRDANLYYIAFSKDGKKSIIVFEPSEEMVGYIKHYLPYGASQEN